MSKKKKTRKQKEISRLRRELQVTNSTNSLSYQVSDLSLKETPQSASRPSQISSHTHYTYVLSDMRKTLYVTAAIFIGNFILYFLISRNLLPFLK